MPWNGDERVGSESDKTTLLHVLAISIAFQKIGRRVRKTPHLHLLAMSLFHLLPPNVYSVDLQSKIKPSVYIKSDGSPDLIKFIQDLVKHFKEREKKSDLSSSVVSHVTKCGTIFKCRPKSSHECSPRDFVQIQARVVYPNRRNQCGAIFNSAE